MAHVALTEYPCGIFYGISVVPRGSPESIPPRYVQAWGHPLPHVGVDLPNCQESTSPHSRLIVRLNLPVTFFDGAVPAYR